MVGFKTAYGSQKTQSPTWKICHLLERSFAIPPIFNGEVYLKLVVEAITSIVTKFIEIEGWHSENNMIFQQDPPYYAPYTFW